MTKRKPYRPPRRPRVMLSLEHTHRQVEVRLCFDSSLALDYSAEFLRRAGKSKVPAAGIVRAALLQYAHGLDTASPVEHFATARRACNASFPDQSKQQMAELRLVAVPDDEPLPSFRVVRVGPAAIQAHEDFEARVEALLPANYRTAVEAAA